jgi:hypothetical protein
MSDKFICKTVHTGQTHRASLPLYFNTRGAFPKIFVLIFSHLLFQSYKLIPTSRFTVTCPCLLSGNLHKNINHDHLSLTRLILIFQGFLGSLAPIQGAVKSNFFL